MLRRIKLIRKRQYNANYNQYFTQSTYYHSKTVIIVKKATERFKQIYFAIQYFFWGTLFYKKTFYEKLQY